NLSLHGYARPTSPNLERLAQQGVSFTRAIAPSSWTLPSHATMFTGRRLRETAVAVAKPYRAAFPTLAEVLGQFGYESAGFVGNTGFLCPGYGLHRGFVHYESFGRTLVQTACAARIIRNVISDDKVRELTGFHDEPGRQRAAELNFKFRNWLESRD